MQADRQFGVRHGGGLPFTERAAVAILLAGSGLCGAGFLLRRF